MTTILLIYLFLASGLMINSLQLLALPFWFLRCKRIYSFFVGKLNYMIFCWPICIAQWWANIEIHNISSPEGFQKAGKERALVVQNHKSQLDWVAAFLVADSISLLEQSKAIVKKLVKYVPVFGFSVWFLDFIFLERRMDRDKPTIEKVTKSLKENDGLYNILMFPEGTRFTPARHKRSQEYALKNGIQPLKCHLVPRTKGFVMVTQELRNSLEMLYDATVCVRGRKNPTFLDMLQGKPAIIDYFVRRVSLAEVPKDESTCKQYLYDVYQEKDRLFEHHLQHEEFPFGKSDPKYSTYISKKLPKRQPPLYVVLCLSVLSVMQLIYFVYFALTTGVLGVLVAIFLIVVSIFLLFVKILTPKST
ncbi:unnamed protein product [Clavelina lepadiformis]|uniref:Phospholipid/glycerol acyltransferase domain-containing protein n=1 Tax=Clavelina lepadiformis TaxID=159417 RepID=A0ABP0G8P2_CLALP